MRASVHVADVGLRSALALTRKPPAAGSIPGLRNAEVGIAAPLSASLLPKPQFGRAAFVGFWEDDDAIDRFVAEHPLAAQFASGWQTRLEPLRAFGSWPGLPPEVPSARRSTRRCWPSRSSDAPPSSASGRTTTRSSASSASIR